MHNVPTPSLIRRVSPGPWSFEGEAGQIRERDGWAIGTVPHAIAGTDIDQHNGALMAASWELGQLVHAMVLQLEQWHKRVPTATAVVDYEKALISKARELLK